MSAVSQITQKLELISALAKACATSLSDGKITKSIQYDINRINLETKEIAQLVKDAEYERAGG